MSGRDTTLAVISTDIRSSVSRTQAEEECAAEHSGKILLKIRRELFHTLIFRIWKAGVWGFFPITYSVWITEVRNTLCTSELSAVLGHYRHLWPEVTYYKVMPQLWRDKIMPGTWVGRLSQQQGLQQHQQPCGMFPLCCLICDEQRSGWWPSPPCIQRLKTASLLFIM